MEQVQALPSQELPDVVVSTWSIYAPLLNSNASAITSVPKHTYSYGSHERQKLDVYTPRDPGTATRQKVLIFVYGGGFSMGDRTLSFPPFNQLAYANLAAFFATNYGFTVVIPDYRRIPDPGEPRYPSGGEDVEKTIEWILQNQDKVAASPSGVPIDLYVMGNSAGSAHTLTFLLHPDFQATRKKVTVAAASGPALKGIVLLGTPFVYAPEMAKVLGRYFGDEADSLDRNSPLGQVQALDVSGGNPDFVESGTRFLIATSELDPPPFHTTRDSFVEVWKSKLQDKAPIDLVILAGHNHISPPIALATGRAKDEEWGRNVAEWILKD